MEVDGLRYYYEGGEPLEGPLFLGGSWYWLDPARGGAMATGVACIDGSWYRYGADGRMVTGWHSDGGRSYYYDPLDGTLTFRNRCVDGSWYWFDLAEGYMWTGPAYIDGAWYRYGADGRMLHGRQCIDGAWYFYDLVDGHLFMGSAYIDGAWYWYDLMDGKMRFGWLDIDGTYYYYDRLDGRMSRGWKVIDGDSYWFDETSGRGDNAQYYRWLLSAAPSSPGAQLFNGASLSAGVLSRLEEVSNEFSRYGYSLGYLVMDIRTGKGVCRNVDDMFYSASTVKAPYMASVYSYSLGGDMGAIDSWYSTCYNTAVYSSNSDYGALRRAFGSSGFSEWLRAAGASSVDSQAWYPYFSPRALGKMWLQMYSDFSKGEMGDSLSSLFSHSANSGIYGALGDRYSVRSKPGWITGGALSATNDAGIVYSDSGDYLMVVLSTAPAKFGMVRDVVRCLDDAHSDMMQR